MDGPFSGRVALITGASGGTGQALARRLATGGAVPGLSYSDHGQAAQALTAEITSAGGTAPAIGRRPAPPAGPQSAHRDGRRSAGPGGCAVLVSNARLSHLQPLEDITAAQLDGMLAVNLRAPFLLAQCAAGSMRERGSGRILLISRVAAFTGGIVGRIMRRPRPGCTDPHPGLPARRNQDHGQRAGAGAGCRDQDAARRPGPAARQVPAAGSASHPRSPTSPRPSSPRPT